MGTKAELATHQHYVGGKEVVVDNVSARTGNQPGSNSQHRMVPYFWFWFLFCRTREQHSILLNPIHVGLA